MSTSATTGREHDVELTGRVQRLLQFLRETVEARTEPVLRFEDHEQIEWLDGEQLAGHLERGAVQGDVLLRAPKTSASAPPEIPEVLVGWVDEQAALDSTTEDLVLADSKLGVTPATAKTESESESETDFDVRRAYEVRTAFDAYSVLWQKWATADRKLRPQAALYQSLQLMMQELSSRPESVELVLASGFLTLPGSTPQEVVRTHVVTQYASIERDVRTGDLLVRLSAHSQPRLEDTQLFTGMDIFDASGSVALSEDLARRAASPLAESIFEFLQEWAARALTVSVETTDDAAPGTANRSRTLTPSPALVLRTRNSFALVEYYEQMIADLDKPGAAVPLGLAQLVDAIEPADRLTWLERTGAAASATLATDPLFPLPANAEQSQIVERLGRDSGVVVEGPPGTGKTHTIANLMSALLARGQRVLVTSEKSQALRVLRDKLPAELQELCVSITDLSRGGSDELGRSVAKIAERKASFNDVGEAKKIDALRAQRDSAIAKRDALIDRVAALREAETVVHEYVSDGYDGTAASIVRKVKAGEDAHAWLPGPLFADRPPLSGTEVDRLRTLIASAPADRAVRTRQTLPRPDTMLPNSAELQALCERAAASVVTGSPQSTQIVEFLAGVDPTTAQDIRTLCDQLAARVREVYELDGVYQRVTDSVLSGEATHLWARAGDIDELVTTAAASDRYVGAHDVQCGDTSPVALQAMNALAAAMEAGAAWKGRFRRSDEQKAVEDLGAVATVDGSPADTAIAVRIVTEHIRAIDAVQTASVLLADLLISVPAEGTRSVRVNHLTQVADRLASVAGVVQARDALVHRLYAISPSAPWIRSLPDAAEVAGAAGVISTRVDVDAARAELNRIMYSVATAVDSGPSPEGLALVTALGNADAAAVAVAVSAYSAACADQDDQQRLEDLSEMLAPVAPALFDLVKDTAGDPEWDELSWQMSKAWAWRRAREWVGEQHDGGAEQRFEAELVSIDADIAYLTSRLAAASAWRDCLGKMTAVEVRALQTYREHISSIGTGTGKYAETYRSAARSAMREAQSAVPAWVMPLAQVLASIPPVPDSFDVVIVDEASQADISSLFLLYLAPRVIVVGDDKQCAPAEVPRSGTLEDVFARLDVYLPDLPEHVRATLTPRSSLFSMLRTRFGQVVRLREHFRSMPEIINWSSQQFYGDSPLVPVRQFGADRLAPLRHTFVPDAVVTGRGPSLVNPREAVAIADQIVHCLADPAYEGKTFGVVVLQGQSQVDEIRGELIERIGIEQWEDRRLRVGTPPDFQGDERNVVFLSMVVAPDQNFVALTADQFKRRFNVAASRAQDQMWLLHSVTVDRLKRADLRNSLLSYVMSVSPAPAEPMPIGVSRDTRVVPFESLFEQQLFVDLVDQGFHVNPNVEVNGLRIALVVTGGSARLAVECDGDTFSSTPAQRRADLEREQELKRCGWTFWRVRESEYFLDRESALVGLWDTLRHLGIGPGQVEIDAESVRSAEWSPIELDSVPAVPHSAEPSVDEPVLTEVPVEEASGDDVMGTDAVPGEVAADGGAEVEVALPGSARRAATTKGAAEGPFTMWQMPAADLDGTRSNGTRKDIPVNGSREDGRGRK